MCHHSDTIPQTFAGTDNSSPMATGQGYRSVNEVRYLPYPCISSISFVVLRRGGSRG